MCVKQSETKQMPCCSASFSLTTFRVDKDLQRKVVLHSKVMLRSSAEGVTRAYLGLKIIAHDRHMVEQGVGQHLSGLIPLAAVTTTALCVPLKRGWLGFDFSACACKVMWCREFLCCSQCQSC